MLKPRVGEIVFMSSPLNWGGGRGGGRRGISYES